MTFRDVAFAGLALAFAACGSQKPAAPENNGAAEAPPPSSINDAAQPVVEKPAEVPASPTEDTFKMPADAVATATGLKTSVERPGTGQAASKGQVVSVHYTGWLPDGTRFDSSRTRGEAFTFPLGAGQVIPGWDEGVALMKEGEVRWLVVPPELGYGPNGSPPVIPPNSTLVFRVELLKAG